MIIRKCVTSWYENVHWVEKRVYKEIFGNDQKNNDCKAKQTKRKGVCVWWEEKIWW